MEQNNTETATVDPIDNTESKTVWERVRASLYSVAAVMIAFGSWADTKELTIEIVNLAKASFTHEVEFEELDQLDVGNYLAFAEGTFGTPRVIKNSKINSDINYRYYPHDKYLLTLITKSDRIEGYVVQGMDLSDEFNMAGAFSPPLPFVQQPLGQQPFAGTDFPDQGFQFDNFNLTYFMEKHPLGAEGMYLDLYVGITDYNQTNPHLHAQLSQLDKTLISGTEQETQTELSSLRSRFNANFFALSKLDEELIAESLLTKYEFSSYL